MKTFNLREVIFFAVVGIVLIVIAYWVGAISMAGRVVAEQEQYIHAAAEAKACQSMFAEAKQTIAQFHSRYTLLGETSAAVTVAPAPTSGVSPTGKLLIEVFGMVAGLPPGISKLVPSAMPATPDRPAPTRWLIKGKVQPYTISGGGEYFYVDPQTRQVEGPFQPERAQ